MQHCSVDVVMAYDEEKRVSFATVNRHSIKLSKQGAITYRGGAIYGSYWLAMVYICSQNGYLVAVWEARCFDIGYDVQIVLELYHTLQLHMTSHSNCIGIAGKIALTLDGNCNEI